ncbi:hypothetical protein SAMN02927923_01865 [Microvirga guangxiensis]|uniref:Uncharacterized protein n=2 Tax=Microvirga guangxiensis TaxID=549386 RepID=A0A1G5HQE0_9HYPH|nr:hypothetical protein SAMN02927923_01865 [Microvirga guangxiensis]
MSRASFPFPVVPDCDDTLRRLADVLQIPLTCRNHRCRRAGQCQGGYGPPCYFENHGDFVAGVREQMPEYREYWSAQRRTAKAALRR